MPELWTCAPALHRARARPDGTAGWLRSVTILMLVWLSAGLSPAAAQQAEAAPVAADSAEVRISPRGAFLRSLVLPGWGQAVVGAPVRGGIYFAMEAGSLWMLYKASQQLGEARERQRFLRDVGDLGPDQQLPLVTAREDQYEDWLTLSIFFLFFAGADAYVAAQLSDFQDRVGVQPGPGGEVRLNVTFPVGSRR